MSEEKPIILYANGKPHMVACAGEHHVWRLSTFIGHLDGAVRAAQECRECRPPTCETHGVHDGFCRPCHRESERRKLHEAFAKAHHVPITEYAGEMVVGDDSESYTPTEDWRDAEDDAFELDDGTRFFWGTEPETPTVDIERELESWLETHHEAACEQVDYKKLRAAGELLNEALSGVSSCYADESVAVILPARELLCCECDEPINETSATKADDVWTCAACATDGAA